MYVAHRVVQYRFVCHQIVFGYTGQRNLLSAWNCIGTVILKRSRERDSVFASGVSIRSVSVWPDVAEFRALRPAFGLIRAVSTERGSSFG